MVDEESMDSEIRRLAREIVRMEVEEEFYREMLDITENNIVELNERNRLREETRESWTMEYYDMANRFVETGSFNDGNIRTDENIPPTTRQLDQEIADLAILVAELTPFLPEDDQGKGNEESPRVVEEEIFEPSFDEEIDPDESKKKDSKYNHFLIVDEHGQLLGAGSQGSKAATNVSNSGGYITVGGRGASSDSVWRSITELAASTNISVAATVPAEQGHQHPPPTDSPASSYTAVGIDSGSESENQPVRSPMHVTIRGANTVSSQSPARVGRRGRVIVSFDSMHARSAGELAQMERRQNQSPTGFSTSRGQYHGSWRSEGRTVRQTTVDNSQSDSTLAYSMLDDENNFVFIPILPDQDRDEENPSAAAADRPQLNEVQKLWQAELDSSSGNFIRYSLPPHYDRGNPASATPTGIINTRDGRFNIENMQRSLLHRALIDPSPSSSKK